MSKSLKSILPFLLCFVLVLAGCGGESADDPIKSAAYYPQTGNPADTPAGEEGGGPLASICAVPYDSVASIKLNIKETEENLTPVSNGDLVGAGEKTLCIDVSPRYDGERVFVSDGGRYVEEAFLNKDDLYECKFTFDADNYNAHPLLIQAIYKNGLASKKKYVLATNTEFKAGDGQLVKNGLGITVGKDLLAGLGGSIESLIGEAMGIEATVNEFKPADNASNAGKEGVLYLDIDGLLTGDMVINDTTPEGDRKLYISFEDDQLLGGGFIGWAAGIFLSLTGNEITLSMSALSMDLGDLLGGLGGEEGDDDLLGSILGGLELDKLLFINAFGRPEDTTPAYAALGAGLYVAEGEDVLKDSEGNNIFPEVIEDEANGKMSIEPIIPAGDFNMGVGLSKYNLNQVLEGIATGLKVPLPAASLPIPLAIPARAPGTSQVLEITLNPKGLTIDMDSETGARMDITDMRMEYIEEGNVKWQLSLDIALNLGIGVSSDEEGGLFLDLTMEPIEGLCNAHVMKDNMGICIFDNSDFVITLFATLSEMMAEDGAEAQADAPFSVSIPLDSFLNPAIGTEKAGAIDFDDSGNCFMNLAVDSIESGALCFISSATVW